MNTEEGHSMVPHGTKLFHCIYLLNAEITPGYLFYVSKFVFMIVQDIKLTSGAYLGVPNTNIQKDAKI